MSCLRFPAQSFTRKFSLTGYHCLKNPKPKTNPFAQLWKVVMHCCFKWLNFECCMFKSINIKHIYLWSNNQTEILTNRYFTEKSKLFLAWKFRLNSCKMPKEESNKQIQTIKQQNWTLMRYSWIKLTIF